MHYANQKGLELAASYSLMPNMLKYCGENDFYSIFRRYLGNKCNRIAATALSSSLKKFKSHYAYLKTIAQANRKQPFDKEIVNAFWIGNPLLYNVSKERIKQLILNDLCLAGMNKQRAANKARGLSNGILIHHSFNSLYLNFVGNRAKRTTVNYDKCRIGWGRVIGLADPWTASSIQHPAPGIHDRLESSVSSLGNTRLTTRDTRLLIGRVPVS